MYLHAYKLKVPNSVEPLDLQTSDPFDSNIEQSAYNHTDQYDVVEELHDLNDPKTFDVIDNSDPQSWTPVRL